ncbi:MAG: hypothetical protein ABJB74_11815 [Gemmatimonas sp.]
MLRSPWSDLRARNGALLPCIVLAVAEDGATGGLAPVANLSSLPTLRHIAPVLLLCSELQRRSIADRSAQPFDGVIAETSSPSATHLAIGAAAARWWRRELGERLQARCGVKSAVPRDVLSVVFHAASFPVDCASLARMVGVSNEHLSRVMPRVLGDVRFTPKLLLDLAVTMELLVRLGVGCNRRAVASELHVSMRTLHRALLRTNCVWGPGIVDFRALLGAAEFVAHRPARA